MRFTSGATISSRGDFPIHGEPAGTMITSRFRARTRGSPATRPFACKRSISTRLAERKTSTGAPCSICCVRRPDGPALIDTSTFGCARRKSAATSSVTSRRLAATETSIFVGSSRRAHPTATRAARSSTLSMDDRADVLPLHRRGEGSGLEPVDDLDLPSVPRVADVVEQDPLHDQVVEVHGGELVDVDARDEACAPVLLRVRGIEAALVL